MIRVVRNEAGNCVTFQGSSNPAYWNACLSGQVDADYPDTVNVLNDIITSITGVDEYEFFRVPYTEFEDADGNSFASAQECADYITEKANVIGLSGEGIDLVGESICFHLDATSTSIVLSNGYSYGVNTIKAIEEGGHVSIVSIDTSESIKHFYNLEVGNACIGSTTISGGVNDIVNALNELFTVGAFESVVISDPFSTMVADVAGVDAEYTLEGTTAIDPVGDDIFTNSSSGSLAGLKSVATIDQAGEYFTFDIRGEGQIGFGLVHTQASYDDGYYSGSATYADPTTFATQNNAHYGFQFSHWFHPTPNGSWTNYGANTSYSQREAWYNSNVHFEARDEWLAGDPIKIKVGLDENGYISIASLADDGITWKVHARTSYPAAEGSEFHLGIKTANASAKVYTAPKVHHLEEDDTPTTIGDTNIDVFGTATGTLAGGVTVSDSSGNNDGFITVETLSAAGEYFEFEVNENEDHIIGLFSEDDYDVATVQADTADWNKGKYIFLGGKINTNEQLTSTVYKNGSGAGIGSTVLNRPTGCTHFRIGFDTQGRATVWSSTDGVNFVASIHHSSAAPTGDYKLMWVADTNGATFEGVTKGQLSAAPVMNFRWIESPDGNFHYPLFATEEEANYYDLHHDGVTGTGTNVPNIFPDEATNTTWYEPTTGHTHNGTAAPTSGTFEGNAIQWTEITSLSNADLVPPAFTDTTITVDELSAVNYQVSPVDVGYTTTIGGIPNWSIPDGHTLQGTAPEVTGDNVSNPSDTTTVTVYRTNTYGTSQGTLTINITNLTAPVVTPITGFTWDSGSTALIDSNTMDDGSVVHVDEQLADNKRFVIYRDYVEDNILPALQEAGDKYYIGLATSGGHTFPIDHSDFDAAIMWEYESATSHTFKFIHDGSIVNNIVVNSLTNAFYDYAIEADGTSAWLIACNANAINNEPSPNDGGSFSNSYEATSLDFSFPQNVYFAVIGNQADFSENDLSQIDTPTAPTTLTNWTKAVDFSGSSERAQQVSSSSNRNAIYMSGLSNTVTANANSGYTTSLSTGRPWATAIVFSADYNNSNQHIWNLGEGSGSTDDNIYLRLASDRRLYFGWGRTGALNELYLGTLNPNIAWYGCYIGFNGTRLSGNNATPANLAECFDVRLLHSGNNFTMSTYEWSNSGASTGWNSSFSTTGGRMDRQFTGDFTIGGRGANRNFHGKVASMVVTTLRNNVLMPTNAEIELMITDPVKWLDDYKVGQPFRLPWQGTNAGFNFARHDGSAGSSTQVWLMGDGGNDSYSNMIRNRVQPNDQNNTKLNLISMVSNDIQNVTIPGLS